VELRRRERLRRWLPERLHPEAWRSWTEAWKARQRAHGETWLPRAREAARDAAAHFARARGDVGVVTACDANYAELAVDMIDSLRGHAELGELPVTVLDCGMRPEQVEVLRAREAVAVQAFPWPDDVRKRWRWPETCRAHLCVERMPELVPGHEILLWIDADIWLQTPAAVVDAVAIASCRVLAIAAEAVYNADWEPRYRKFLGRRTAARLAGRPIFNTGIFASHIDTPFWELFRARGDASAALAPHRLSDQSPMNELLYLFDVPFLELPPSSNWVVSVSPPVWDERRGLWVSPEDQKTPISGVHLTGRSKWEPMTVTTVDGEERSLSCTFRAWHELRAAER